MGPLERRAAQRGADLVLEGGGVKGIALTGAVIALADAGYVFPRIGGTSAGAIVAALTAAWQTAGRPLGELRTELRALDYRRFRSQCALQRLTGPLGRGVALVTRLGIYRTDLLDEWLVPLLERAGVRTFADLKIIDDDGSDLRPEQRYRLVTHVSDLTRRCVVRVPWDLPQYLLPEGASTTESERIRVIDDYPVVEAVRASMAIPYYFSPVVQATPQGGCTWVDGGLLAYFPVSVFDRTDGRPSRWPTFGVKLSSRPPVGRPEMPVRTLVGETAAILRTATGQWNRYALEDEGVAARTVWVDTTGVEMTDFDIDPVRRDALDDAGRTAAEAFLAYWERTHPA